AKQGYTHPCHRAVLTAAAQAESRRMSRKPSPATTSLLGAPLKDRRRLSPGHTDFGAAPIAAGRAEIPLCGSTQAEIGRKEDRKTRGYKTGIEQSRTRGGESLVREWFERSRDGIAPDEFVSPADANMEQGRVEPLRCGRKAQ